MSAIEKLYNEIKDITYPTDIPSPNMLKTGILNGTIEPTSQPFQRYAFCAYLSMEFVAEYPVTARQVEPEIDSKRAEYFQWLCLHCDTMSLMKSVCSNKNQVNFDEAENKLEDLKDRIEKFIPLSTTNNLILNIDLANINFSLKFLNIRHKKEDDDFKKELATIIGNYRYYAKQEEGSSPHKTYFFSYIYDLISKIADLLLCSREARDKNLRNILDYGFSEIFIKFGKNKLDRPFEAVSFFKKAVQLGNRRAFKFLNLALYNMIVKESENKKSPIVLVGIKEEYWDLMRKFYLEARQGDITRNTSGYLQSLYLLMYFEGLSKEEKQSRNNQFLSETRAIIKALKEKQKIHKLGDIYALLYGYYILLDYAEALKYAIKAAKTGTPDRLEALYLTLSNQKNNIAISSAKNYLSFLVYKDPDNKDKVDIDVVLRLGAKYKEPNCMIRQALKMIDQDKMQNSEESDADKIERIKQAIKQIREAQLQLSSITIANYLDEYKLRSNYFPEKYKEDSDIALAEYFIFHPEFLREITADAISFDFDLTFRNPKEVSWILNDSLSDLPHRATVLCLFMDKINEKLSLDDYRSFLEDENTQNYKFELQELLKFTNTNFYIHPERLSEVYILSRNLYVEFLEDYQEFSEKEIKESKNSFLPIPRPSKKPPTAKPKGKSKGKGGRNRSGQTYNQKRVARKPMMNKEDAGIPSTPIQLAKAAPKTAPTQQKTSSIIRHERGAVMRPNLEIIQKALERYRQEDAHMVQIKNFYQNKARNQKKYARLIDALFDSKSNKRSILDYQDIPDLVRFFYPECSRREGTKGTGGGHVISVGSAAYTIHKTKPQQKGHGGSVSSFIKFLIDAYDAVKE